MKNFVKFSSKIICMLFLVVICFYCKGQESDADYTKTPVFFVHGHNCIAKSWEWMISFLVRSGYPRQYLKAIQLYPKDGSNIDAAEEQIAPAIEKFLESVNEYIEEEQPGIALKTKVDLISHSMGALSARWYTAKMHPDRVRIWLSLVGANHGTDPLCGASGQGADDMCPAFAKSSEESFIQYALNGGPHVADIDETPYGIGMDSPGTDSIMPDERRNILYVTVRVGSDKWIKPGNSAILDGAGGINILIPEKIQAHQTSTGNILMTDPLHHDGLLKDKVILELVKVILGVQDEKIRSKFQIFSFGE